MNPTYLLCGLCVVPHWVLCLHRTQPWRLQELASGILAGFSPALWGAGVHSACLELSRKLPLAQFLPDHCIIYLTYSSLLSFLSLPSTAPYCSFLFPRSSCFFSSFLMKKESSIFLFLASFHPFYLPPAPTSVRHMERVTFFKRCHHYRAKLPSTNGHDFCLFCLGEGHKVDSCPHSAHFMKQARKNQAAHLQSHLTEISLHPGTSVSSSSRPSLPSPPQMGNSAVPETSVASSSKKHKPDKPQKRLSTLAKGTPKSKKSKPSPASASVPSVLPVSTPTPPSDIGQGPSGTALAICSDLPTAPLMTPAQPPDFQVLHVPSRSPSVQSISPAQPPSQGHQPSGAEASYDLQDCKSSQVLASRRRSYSWSRSRSSHHRCTRYSRSPTYDDDQHDWDRCGYSSGSRSLTHQPRSHWHSQRYHSSQSPSQSSHRSRGRSYSRSRSSHGYQDSSYTRRPEDHQYLPSATGGLQSQTAEATASVSTVAPVVPSTMTAPSSALAPASPAVLGTLPVLPDLRRPVDIWLLSSEPSVIDSEGSDSEYNDLLCTSREPEVALPPEGSKAYLDFITRLATALDVQVTNDTPKVTDVVHQLVQSDLPPRTVLPMLPVHLEVLKEAWEKPASVPPASKRLEAFYKVPRADAKFLFSHPAPNSVIVHCATKSKRLWQGAPPDREGRKIDTLAQKVYSLTATVSKMHNYLAYFSGYALHLADQFAPLLSELSPASQQTATALMSELTRISKHQIHTLQHTVSCSSKLLSTAIALRRHAWLRSTFLRPDIQEVIESLPFDGEGLFHSTTDKVLTAIDESRKVAKSLSCSRRQRSPRRANM